MQLLNECYHASKQTALNIIAKNTLDWGKESCYRIMNLLDLQDNLENTSDLEFSPEKCEFINHSSFQSLLPYFWSGPFRIAESPWLVSTFYFCCICLRKSN